MDKVIEEFCKVQFLCYGGDPNWLGWIVLAIAGVIAIGVALTAIGFAME